TPVIDAAARRIYLDAMTTPNGGATKAHQIFALDLDTGTPIAANGFPLNVDQQFMLMSFDSAQQNQRASLLLLNGVVYAAYSGHDGDCDPYFGWVIGVPVNNATGAVAWR